MSAVVRWTERALSMNRPHDPSSRRLLGGRYRLESTLGRGGMGVVYVASDLTMHRQVAVKVVRGEDGEPLDDETVSRFLREAKNTSRVHHENIVEVFDLGASGAGELFFVMELLEGESLSARLRRDGRLDPVLAVHVARQICAALHVAHVNGIVHRDLKPANVMLVPRGHDPNFVKVLDFGVAKSNAADQATKLTGTGMLVGTIEYMAPEQITARNIDGRADMYALGVVLYKMLTGRNPFKDAGVPYLINAHLNLVPPPPSTEVPSLPRALDEVVLRALAKNPNERYRSMEEMSVALRHALGAPERPLGLVNLEYAADDEEDDYGGMARTELVSPSQQSQPGSPTNPPASRSAPVQPGYTQGGTALLRRDEITGQNPSLRHPSIGAPPPSGRGPAAGPGGPGYHAPMSSGPPPISLPSGPPMHGYSSGPPSAVRPAASHAPPESTWQRFLKWAGLR